MKALTFVSLVLIFYGCNYRHPTSQAQPTAERRPESRLRRIAEVPSGPNTYSLQCVSRLICWVGDFKKQWRTDDGGKHWQLIYESQRQGDEVNTLKYVDERVGWLLTLTKLFKTEDGGKNWIEQK